MNLGKYITDLLDNQGRSKVWLAEQLNINYKTLTGKLKRDSITSQELLKIAKILEINLNKLKEMMVMELNQKDKETLVRAITFYYENYVWKDLLSKDSSAASDEDYNLRYVVNKLNLKLPQEIQYRL